MTDVENHWGDIGAGDRVGLAGGAIGCLAIGPVLTLVVGQVSSAVVSLGVALALTLGYLGEDYPGSWWLLGVAAVLQGIIMGFMMPSRTAIIPELVGEEQVMTENDTLPSGRTRIDHLEMKGIVKRFPGVLANDQVDFDVRAGEVHALLGENGAGKSTLMKVLYGMYEADEGTIWLNGERVEINSPTDAIELGIGMIHQHFMLVESLTVAENVALGLPSSRGRSDARQAACPSSLTRTSSSYSPAGTGSHR